MMQLLNELHALSHDPVARKSWLLESICGLFGARIGLLSFLRDEPGPWRFHPVPCSEFGWDCDKERLAVQAYREDDLSDIDHYRDPMDVMLTIPGRVVTRKRTDLVDDAHWYGRGNVNDIRHPGRIDDCVYSLYRVSRPGWVVAMGVHRPWRDRARFSQRDRNLLHLLNSHLGWMWNHEVETANPSLSPRLRQTLALLLGGQSEKDVAKQLCVSRNTVHKYVTALYRVFGVESRAELMALKLGAFQGVEKPRSMLES